eukprot:8919794-Karenia_brevis.AAC.1
MLWWCFCRALLGMWLPLPDRSPKAIGEQSMFSWCCFSWRCLAMVALILGLLMSWCAVPSGELVTESDEALAVL